MKFLKKASHVGSLFYFSHMSKERLPPSGFSIKLWAEDDRPREKLILKGRQALSDAELLAILIGSGTREASAVQLAQEMLVSVNHDLNALSLLTLKQLTKFKGIGQARGVTILAALEIGRRRKESAPNQRKVISSSADAFNELYPLLSDLDHERFYILLLNRSNVVTSAVKISEGGVSGTVADAKLIFKAALEGLSSGIILAHNHPSGNLKPSTADINLTKRLVDAGKLLEINVLDHIIIAGKEYYSFADEGLL